MDSTPLRAYAAEEALSGASAEGVAEAVNSTDEGTRTATDDAASAEFRRYLARV